MSYRGPWYGSTDGARDYLADRDAAERVEQRVTPSGAHFMASVGMTCQQWLDQYYAKQNALRNPLGNGHQRKQESDHDDQDGREATGPQAAEGRAGEGLGDTAGEQEEGAAAGHDAGGPSQNEPGARGAVGGDWIEQAIGPWAEEAYPQGEDFTERDRTPF